MEPDNKANDSLPEELDKLKDVEGISIKDGLEFCGSPKAFLKFLNTFYKSIDEKTASIKEAYDKADFNTYTIRVHALKSTSRIIGAFKLSDMAKELEKAGDAGDIQFIKDNTDKFLSFYNSYKDKLSVVKELCLENCLKKPPIPKEILEDAYKTLREFIPSMDYDAVEFVLNGIGKYRLEPKDQKIMEDLGDNLKKLDWDKMEEIIKSV